MLSRSECFELTEVSVSTILFHLNRGVLRLEICQTDCVNTIELYLIDAKIEYKI